MNELSELTGASVEPSVGATAETVSKGSEGRARNGEGGGGSGGGGGGGNDLSIDAEDDGGLDVGISMDVDELDGDGNVDGSNGQGAEAEAEAVAESGESHLEGVASPLAPRERDVSTLIMVAKEQVKALLSDRDSLRRLGAVQEEVIAYLNKDTGTVYRYFVTVLSIQ